MFQLIIPGKGRILFLRVTFGQMAETADFSKEKPGFYTLFFILVGGDGPVFGRFLCIRYIRD